jgi:glycosyltransferase involved in cell wall biosynthesis/uncharacterized protein YjbI with pentapeptide repeats
MLFTKKTLITIFFLSLVLFVSLQVWATYSIVEASRRSAQDVHQYYPQVDATKLAQAKTQEEIVGLRIENERKAVFLSTLTANLNAALAVFVTLIGGGIAFHQYIDVRRKERLDRSATELTQVWQGMTSSEGDVRASSIAALQQFFGSEMADFHPNVASALALIGRIGFSTPVVAMTYARVIESAMRKLAPAVLRSVSWQGVNLRRTNLSKLSFDGFDFRDADLRDCILSGSTFRDSKLDAAKLNWAELVGVDLTGASLRYADLAGANMEGASLRGANLRHARILGTNLAKANLTDVNFRHDSLDWSLTRHWRDAVMNKPLREALLSVHGPKVTGTRVLMLSWEYPPFVSGGGWTAVFHLLRTLRLLGHEKFVDHASLGYEYDVHCAGIESVHGTYGSYEGYSSDNASRNGGATLSTSLGAAVKEFTRRAGDLINESGLQFDLVHAHDWLTFEAAEEIATERRVPWVAHFHSTEFDRRNKRPSLPIQRIEQTACISAQTVVAVGQRVRETLIREYRAKGAKTEAIPNCFWRASERIDRVGNFDSGRVVFLGRLTEQKGPDLFVHMASHLKTLRPNTAFEMYGEGELLTQMAVLIAQLWPGEILPPDDLKNAMFPFSRILPVTVNPETGELSLGRPYTSPEVLGDNIKRKVSKIRAIQGFDRYTHLLTTRETPMRHFLVATSVFPSYEDLPDRFVVLRGPLAWAQRRRAFEGASLVVVPSRSEPFGLVILEAMQHGVPVLYPSSCGAAEVLKAGVRIEPEASERVAETANNILADVRYWQQIVEEQVQEISDYSGEGYARRLRDLWAREANGYASGGASDVRANGR